MIPISLYQIDEQLACIKSIYNRQEYLRNLAHSEPRTEVDKLNDILINEGVKDVTKANWAHSIALFITSILEDTDRMYKIVNVTLSTKVRIKSVKTLIKTLFKKGDGNRLVTITKELILNKGSPHLRRSIINTILDDNMQSLADNIIDNLYVSYGPSVALQLLPACTEEVVHRLLPEIVPRPGHSAHKLIIRYPKIMFDFITNCKNREVAMMDYAGEVEYFIQHRIDTTINGLPLVFTYMEAAIDDESESYCREIDFRISRILTALMQHRHSMEAVEWLNNMKKRGVSYRDINWPIEALVRDLGEEKAFGIIYDNTRLQAITFIIQGPLPTNIRNGLTEYFYRRGYVNNKEREHSPTIGICKALSGELDIQGQFAVKGFEYYSDRDKFPYEDQQLEFVEYMTSSDANPILADRLKSSNTDKRTWAYTTRLRQALHYDKKEHRLPEVLATTVNSIANERVPVKEDVMRTISLLPIPPLCEPKCLEPSKVIDAVDNLEATLNRSKEQVKGSSIVKEVQSVISRIILYAPLDSMLYQKWELRVMEAYDRLINNDNSNKSLIDDGFLLNIYALRRVTVDNILNHLSGFLQSVLNTPDRLSKDVIQDLRVIFRLVGGQYKGSSGEGLKLDGIRPIVEDIIDNSEKYTFRPRHPAGTIDMLIEIQSKLADVLKRRPWNKEKGNYLERIIKSHPKLLTDNDTFYTLARKKMPYLFAKYINGSTDDEKPGPPKCCRRFSGGLYVRYDLDMKWWTDFEVEVINNMIDIEYKGDTANSLSYESKYRKWKSFMRTTRPAFLIEDIKRQEDIIKQMAGSSEGGGVVDGDALALMEVDMKALSNMDTVDMESSKVFLTSDILSSDVARTAPFCLSKVSANVLSDKDLFDNLIGPTFKNAPKSNIKLTAHKELCRLVAQYGSIDKRQYWLKYRLFNGDGSRKNVHKDIVESIGSSFIHNMLWSSDWEVISTCIDMSKTIPDALAKYIIPSPATLNTQYSDTTQARCRYITDVLLPIVQYVSDDQVVMDSCVTALKEWSLGTPAILESAGDGVVKALKPILTKKCPPQAMVNQVMWLFDGFVARGSKAALSAEIATFDYLLEQSYKPLVKLDSPSVPRRDEVDCHVLESITTHILNAVTSHSKTSIPKDEGYGILCHISDALHNVLGLEELWNKARIESILYDKPPVGFIALLPSIKDHLNLIEGDNGLLHDCILTIADWLQPSSIKGEELSKSDDYRIRLLAVDMYNREARAIGDTIAEPPAAAAAAIRALKSALWHTLCRDTNMAVRRKAFDTVMSM